MSYLTYKDLGLKPPPDKPGDGFFASFMAGGKSKGQEPPDLDPEELAMGIKVEMEHTGDEKVARKIALDHLTEFPMYYTALKAMEEVLKAMKGEGGKPASFSERIKAKLAG